MNDQEIRAFITAAAAKDMATKAINQFYGAVQAHRVAVQRVKGADSVTPETLAVGEAMTAKMEHVWDAICDSFPEVKDWPPFPTGMFEVTERDVQEWKRQEEEEAEA